VLVNNAGTYCGHKVITGDGVERTFAVNHLAPFLLTHLLLPILSASPLGRVITVSSDSHYHARIVPEKVSNPWFYFGLRAYSQSKLANVLFTAEFNRRNKTSSPRAFAVDPGLVNTDIGLKETGPLAGLAWKSRQRKGVKPEVPARTILHLAGGPSLQNSDEIYWKDSLPKQPNRSAFDPELARRLWEVSCKLCHINDYFTE
jgi:retinol dehydrogenase-12